MIQGWGNYDSNLSYGFYEYKIKYRENLNINNLIIKSKKVILSIRMWYYRINSIII